MSLSYTRPTSDYRQRRKPVRTGNGILGPGYRETISYELILQRKWLVYNGVSPDIKDHVFGTVDGSLINGVAAREEWRDVPTVDET